MFHILNNDIGKIEIAPTKQWTTQTMINNMEERRKAKTIDAIEYRRLNNQLRKETDRAKDIYMVCDKIMELQKTKQFGVSIIETIRTFGIEDNRGDLVPANRQALRIWEGGYIYMIRKIPRKIL